MQKKCILDETKLCDDCGECDYCDINPFKICDNCGKCIDTDEEYKEIKIDKVDLSYQASKNDDTENHQEHNCDCENDHEHNNDTENHHEHNCDCGCED